jgi:hypothetical protein
MEITLDHLKKLWDDERIKKIRAQHSFMVASERVLDYKKRDNLIFCLDAVWSDNHDELVEKRNSSRRFKHIFVSQICDVACEEYKTVCQILDLKGIILVAYEGEYEYLIRCEKELDAFGIKTNKLLISDKPRKRPVMISKIL